MRSSCPATSVPAFLERNPCSSLACTHARIEADLIAMRSGFPSGQLYAWDCAFEGAPSSTFLLEEREEKGLGDVLLANGLPGFESGVHGSDLSDDICSRPSS